MSIHEFEITDIWPPARDHHRITHVRVPALGGYIVVETIIRYLRPPKTYNFFVRSPYGEKAYVGIFEQAGRSPCLRTFADRTWNDNLLSLPSRQAA